MKIEAYAHTDVGRLRPANEDAFLVQAEARLFAVADGMGGHSAGEVASRLAIETVGAAPPDGSVPLARLGEFLQARVLQANDAILTDARDVPERAGMGTTLTVVAFTEPPSHLVYAHVGDTRLYRVRSRELQQLTHDHTWVQEQVDLGLLRPEFARGHPLSSMLSRALGTQQTVQVDIGTLGVDAGDLYLMCSDGLTNMLPDPAIASILQSDASVRTLAHVLVQEANLRGGLDNITALIARVRAY